jgi:hypothetical protein
MSKPAGGMVPGTLDMLVLKTLALEPMHGFGIASRIEQASRDVFRVNAGSLFAAFRRWSGQGSSAASGVPRRTAAAPSTTSSPAGPEEARPGSPRLAAPDRRHREDPQARVDRGTLLASASIARRQWRWWATRRRASTAVGVAQPAEDLR